MNGRGLLMTWIPYNISTLHFCSEHGMPNRTRKTATTRRRSRRPAPSTTMVRGSSSALPRASATVAQNRSLVVKYHERERIAALKFPSTGSFHLLFDGSCQAANPGVFPWGSSMAQLFEKYRIEWIRFHYVPVTGTDTGGLFQLSFDYDTLDDAPTDALSVSQMSVFADSALWRSFTMVVPSDRRILFTKGQALVPGSDPKTYDMGRIYASIDGSTGVEGTTFGYLEVEYEITLLNKQAPGQVSTRAQLNRSTLTGLPATYTTGTRINMSGLLNAVEGHSPPTVNPDGSFTVPAGT